jgi:hypothetical protein
MDSLAISRILSSKLFDYEKVIEKSEKSPYQQIWKKADWNANKFAFVYTEDHLLGVTYFSIRGTEENSLLRMAEELCEDIKTYSMDELFEEYQNCDNPNSLSAITGKLFLLGTNGCDKELLAYLKQLLLDERFAVWDTAHVGITYLGWEEFRETLEEGAKAATLKGKECKRVLEIMDRHFWRKEEFE